MRLRITTTVLIDLATGEAQSKATWQVEGQETGLGAPLAQAAAALTKLASTPPTSDSPEIETPNRAHPAAKEARTLAGLLEIREDVEQALGTRPAGRVLEVLKWIRQKKSRETIRSIPSLFWSLVNKD